MILYFKWLCPHFTIYRTEGGRDGGRSIRSIAKQQPPSPSSSYSSNKNTDTLTSTLDSFFDDLSTSKPTDYPTNRKNVEWNTGQGLKNQYEDEKMSNQFKEIQYAGSISDDSKQNSQNSFNSELDDIDK